MLKNSTTVDDLREQWGSLSPPEQAAAIQGLRGQIANVFGGTKNGDALVKNQLLAPNAQDKLSFLIGPHKAQGLATSLQQEDALAASAKRITGGSPTHENQQASVLSGPSAIPGQIKGYLRGVDLTKPWTWVPGLNAEDILSGHEANQLAKARTQLAPILTSPNGPNADMAKALLGLARTQASRNASAQQMQNMATLLIGAAGRQNLQSGRPQN